MKPIRRSLSAALAALLLLLLLATGAGAHADPLTELAAVSSVKEVNLDKLAAGTVQMARGPALSSPRALSVESVYVIKKTVPKAVEFHAQWNGSKHSELKVYLHGDLTAHPTLAEFQKLGAAPSNGSVKSFATATQKFGSGATELQLSNAEVKAFASQAPGSGAGGLGPKVSAFWSQILFQRAQAFASGGASHLPPYETTGEAVRPAEEIARLLKDAPKVRSHFAALIESTPLTSAKSATPRDAYWELFDVEGQAAVTLGASYTRTSGDTAQAVDGSYYASGGYYALLTFYQFWPVKAAGHDATLVWRADLISAPSLANLHGVERMGSSTAMMRETKKTIESLLKDAAQTP